MSNRLLVTKSINKHFPNDINYEKIGYNPIYCPISDVEELNIKPLENINSTIIITSINAIFALKELNINKNNLIFTAGEKSANIIKKLGYKNIIIGNNSAKSILDNIISDNKYKNHPIKYFSGKKITLDIAKDLKNDGYNADREIIYNITPKSQLLEDIIVKLKNKYINNIAILSINSADIFYNLCYKHNLDFLLPKLHILCLSDNIAFHCKKTYKSKISILYPGQFYKGK
jgi:uroporphyrinogen-III synthase